VTIVKRREKERKLGGMLPSFSHSKKKGVQEIWNGIRKM